MPSLWAGSIGGCWHLPFQAPQSSSAAGLPVSSAPVQLVSAAAAGVDNHPSLAEEGLAEPAGLFHVSTSFHSVQGSEDFQNALFLTCSLRMAGLGRWISSR